MELRAFLVYGAVVTIAVMIGHASTYPYTALANYPSPLGFMLFLISKSGRDVLWDDEAASNSSKLQRYAREGDVLVSSCPKCGTTWTLNIMHQLRVYDDDTLAEHFEDITRVVPWPMLKSSPEVHFDEYWPKYFESDRSWWDEPTYKYRAFKMPFAPSDSPNFILDPGSEKLYFDSKVKHIVVIREPADQLESFIFHVESINPTLSAKLGIPSPQPMVDFVEYFGLFPQFANIPINSVNHLNSWRHHICKPNVLLVHFNDLRNNLDTTLRKIANFVGQDDIPDEGWAKIKKRVSFKWMKENGEKFKYMRPGDSNQTLLTQLVRGSAKRTRITKEIAQEYEQILRKMYPKHVVDYAYHGGAFVEPSCSP